MSLRAYTAMLIQIFDDLFMESWIYISSRLVIDGSAVKGGTPGVVGSTSNRLRPLLLIILSIPLTINNDLISLLTSLSHEFFRRYLTWNGDFCR